MSTSGGSKIVRGLSLSHSLSEETTYWAIICSKKHIWLVDRILHTHTHHVPYSTLSFGNAAFLILHLLKARAR